MRCPICEFGLPQGRTSTCPQCQSDLTVHALIDQLEKSMNLSAKNSETKQSDNRNPLAPTARFQQISQFLFVAILLVLCALSLLTFNLKQSQDRVAVLLERQATLAKTAPPKPGSLDSTELVSTLVLSLQKAIEIYAAERTERQEAVSRILSAQNESLSKLQESAVKQ